MRAFKGVAYIVQDINHMINSSEAEKHCSQSCRKLLI